LSRVVYRLLVLLASGDSPSEAFQGLVSEYVPQVADIGKGLPVHLDGNMLDAEGAEFYYAVIIL
jgi:hypothetical protein